MYRPVPLCDISQVVRTGTYYIIVQVGTGRYVPVRTDMYQVYRIPDDGNTHDVLADLRRLDGNIEPHQQYGIPVNLFAAAGKLKYWVKTSTLALG